MINKQIVLFTLSFILSTNLFAQMNTGYDSSHVKKVRSPERLVLSPGISYQGQWFGELNLMLINEDTPGGGPCSGDAAAGPRIGFETNFMHGNNYIIAPKIGLEAATTPICMRINMVYYKGEYTNDLRLLPELGIDVNAVINLTYGYGFPLLSTRLPEVSRSRITLTFNLDKNYISDY